MKKYKIYIILAIAAIAIYLLFFRSKATPVIIPPVSPKEEKKQPVAQNTEAQRRGSMPAKGRTQSANIVQATQAN
ncbi:MAG: hypothetical protein WCM93_03370 [Bacteroidota bacterium]